MFPAADGPAAGNRTSGPGGAPVARRRRYRGRVADSAPLASGRDADVYALDAGRVLRRYRAGGDVRVEAEVMTHLRGAGFPVPKVYDADGPDLVLERLSGATLTESFVAGVTDVRSGARILADLHRRLHALPARRSAAPDARILHLDLHPGNVILTPDGPVVIDWRNTDEGPPELDTSLSALILAEVATGPTTDLAAPARALLAAYLVEVGAPLLLDRAATLRAGLGPLGATRVGEAVALLRQASR